MFPRPVWVLFAGTLINRLGTFVLVFLVYYLTKLGRTPAEAGAALAAYGAGGILASIAGGDLADRIGRRRAIALSMFAGAASLLCLQQARSVPAILAWSAACGLTVELYRPATSALITDLTPPDRRVTAFAMYRLAINIGATVGPLLGGFLAERSFAWLFWGDAASCALFGLVALLALPASEPSVSLHGREAPLWTILRDRPFRRLLLGSTLSAIVYAQMTSGFALHVKTAGLPGTVYGSLIGLNGLIVLLLELPIASVTGRLPKPPVIGLGFLLIGVGFALTGLAASAWLLAATVTIWTLGEIVAAPISAAYVSELAPDSLRGRYQGALGLTYGIGFAVGPVVGAALFGWRRAALWWTCLALGVAATLLVTAGRARPRIARAS